MLALLLATALADDRDALRAWVDATPPLPITEVAAAYHGQRELFADALAVVDAHPEIVVEQLGHTVPGTPLWALHLPPTDVPTTKVLVFAGIHALEWIATEVALATLHELADHRPAHTAVTVVLLLNPDGRIKVQDDLAAGRNAYRRGNAALVDLNRDFAVNRDCEDGFDKVLPGYHSTSAAPLSQPETRALDALAARERYDRAASLHAFGGFFYFPWSGRWARPPDWAAFVTLGRAMEGAQGARAYKTRQLSRWAFFFRAHGSEIDHLYDRYGTLAFLVELTRSGVRPLHTQDFRTYFRWYNPVDPSRHLIKGVAAMRALIDTELDSPTLQHGGEEGVGVVDVGTGAQEGPVGE